MVFRRMFKRRRRRITTVGACLVIIFILAFVSTGSSNNHRPRANPLLGKQAKFWRNTFQIILNNNPWCQSWPEAVVQTNLKIAYQSEYYHDRPDIMYMDDGDMLRMKHAHAKYISDLREDKFKLVYNKGTRGIITTVSAKSLPVLLVSLRMLRLTGSTLPVEIFLWHPEPFIDHLCSSTFLTLNAKCMFLSDIFRLADTGVGLKSYQHKVFAILFSTFEDILFLDSDAWPASNPDHLFDTEPFIGTGMTTWPDFWFASESPYFFAIADVTNIPEVHERAASEAGILMYSKSRHGPSILLATYYNYYGPDYYYRLQSQNGPGQGDKETFGLAALVMGEPFYAVKSPVTALGRHDSSGDWLGSAMVQFDPNVDWSISKARLQAEQSAEEDKKYYDVDDDIDGSKAGRETKSKKKYGYAASKEDLKLNAANDQHTIADPRRSRSKDTEKQKQQKKKKLKPLPPEELLETTHSPPSIVAAAEAFTNGHPNSHPDLAYLDALPVDSLPPLPNPLFVHTNYPKFNPRTIFTEKVNGAQTPTRDTNGTTVRCWDMTAHVAKAQFGVDIERRLWGVVRTVACRDLLGSRRLEHPNVVSTSSDPESKSGKSDDKHEDNEEENNKKEGEEEVEEIREDADVCADVEAYVAAIYPDLLDD